MGFLGKKHTLKTRKKQSKANSKTFEERFGKERAEELRKRYSQEYKGNKQDVEKLKKAKLIWKEELYSYMELLQKEGFNCFSPDIIRPDIIASKNGKIYAVEIEYHKPNFDKYNNCKFFDDIIWVVESHKFKESVPIKIKKAIKKL